MEKPVILRIVDGGKKTTPSTEGVEVRLPASVLAENAEVYALICGAVGAWVLFCSWMAGFSIGEIVGGLILTFSAGFMIGSWYARRRIEQENDTKLPLPPPSEPPPLHVA